MKILQLIQKPQLRGAELFASQLSNHLLQLGHDVKMVCLLDGTAKLPFTGELINLRRPLSKRFFDREGWRKLNEVIVDFQPDIIQSNASDTLKFAVSSKILFGWKVPVAYRNANKVSDFITSLPKLLLNRVYVSRLQHVISVSELCRLDFIKTYSFPAKYTTMIPIGIDPVVIDKTIPGDLKHHFASGKVFINVASLVPEKNHEGLFRIAARIIKNDPAVRILVIGDGKLRDVLTKRISELGLTANVFLLGYRADVLSIMANAKALLMPSLIEGLPGVILEAFYSNLPVIANDVGGISEVVRKGETGWLINKGDEEGFARAIEAVLNDTTAVDRIRSNAHVLVTRDFTNEMIAARFVETYRSIVDGRKD